MNVIIIFLFSQTMMERRIGMVTIRDRKERMIDRAKRKKVSFFKRKCDVEKENGSQGARKIYLCDRNDR